MFCLNFGQGNIDLKYVNSVKNSKSRAFVFVKGCLQPFIYNLNVYPENSFLYIKRFNTYLFKNIIPFCTVHRLFLLGKNIGNKLLAKKTQNQAHSCF